MQRQKPSKVERAPSVGASHRIETLVNKIKSPCRRRGINDVGHCFSHHAKTFLAFAQSALLPGPVQRHGYITRNVVQKLDFLAGPAFAASRGKRKRTEKPFAHHERKSRISLQT